MKRALPLVPLLVMVACSVPAFGGIVAYNFGGAVNSVFGNPFSGITPHLGDAVVGTFSYDSSAPDSNLASTNLGQYVQQSPRGISLVLQGVTFRSDVDFNLLVDNHAPSYDQFEIYDFSPVFGGQIPPANSSGIEFLLTDLANHTFANDHLPASLNLANFNSNSGEIYTVSGGLFSGVTFSITSLTPIAVPEPAPLILLLLGCLLFVSPASSSVNAPPRRQG